MYKTLATIFIVTLCLSCNQNSRQADEDVNDIQNQDETPAVLNDEKSDLTFTSYKRSGDDIVQNLFNEAISKDQHLKSLALRIESIENIKNDSLELYQEYIANNQAYWRTIERYTNQVTDSTLKKELKEAVKEMESKYEKQISNHKSIDELIQKRKNDLFDQEIIMKILVTEPMMNNYMRNELPNINRLKEVLEAYDSLIKDMKPYTSIRK